MDRLDGEILELADSGTIRYTSIAKKLGAPISTVHMRLKKLEKEGTIKKYKADVDWKKAGLDITAYVMINIDVDTLKRIGKTQDKLLKELKNILDVKEGSIIIGDADLLIKIIAKDTSHLKDILLNYVGKIEGITTTKTFIVLE
jgi:Lrp/AsnC family transcriptional regulator for asnA, asnC and gidA